MALRAFPIENHAQWLRLRREDVTASQVGALFGVHPWNTAAELYAAKVAPQMAPVLDSQVMVRGRKLESVIADEIKERYTAWSIEKCHQYYRDDEKHLGGTPDFFVTLPGGERGVIETKTVGSTRYRRAWSEGPEPYALLQTVVNMYLTGRTHMGVLAPLIIGEYDFDLHMHTVPYHEGLLREVFKRVADFWEHVNTRNPVDLDFRRDAKFVRLLYPSANKGSIVDLNKDNRIRELLNDYGRLTKEVAQIKADFEACKTEIRAKIGESETALVEGYKITLKESGHGSYTVPATVFRRLSVKKLKTEDNDDGDQIEQ